MEGNAAATDSLTRKALVGTGWSALSNVARQVLSFASVAVLARLLGPSAYGLMGMATLVLSFLANFRDMGTATAIIQRPQVSNRLLSSLFWVNCGLGALLACAGFIGAVPAAVFFHEPKLVSLLRVISLTFCITTVGAVPNSILARKMAFDKLAIADFVSALTGYAVAIPCAFAGMGVWSLVIGNLVNFSLAAALYMVFCGWRPSFIFDPAEIRSVTGFSLNLAGFGIVNYFARNADNVVVGRVLGSIQLGYYQMAYNLFLFPIQNISSVIGQVLNPAFSKIQNENERFKSAYIRGCMLIGLITFPVMAGLGVVADPFIRTLLGAKWIPVIPLLQILVPVGIVQSVHGAVGQIFIGKGRTDLMFRLGLYASAMYVTSFLFGVRWGTRGVAAAYAIAYFVFVLYPGLRFPFRLIGLTVGEFMRHLWPQVAITLGMAAVCAAWMTGLLRLISTVLVGAAVYILSMLIIRPAVIVHLEDVIETSRIPFGGGLLRTIRGFARD
jgi:O-antigen/teichoic acid export membrane protein